MLVTPFALAYITSPPAGSLDFHFDTLEGTYRGAAPRCDLVW
jgi:hypothetical protein